MQILLITPRPELWADCLSVLAAAGATLEHAATLEHGKDIIKATPPELVLLDANLEGEALRKAIIALLMINASVHTAVVSDSPEELFHEETEGLGIMMPLPATPTAETARRILEKLAALR